MNENEIEAIRKAGITIGEKTWLATNTTEKVLDFYLKIKPSNLFSSEETIVSGKSTTTRTVPILEEPKMRELWQKWVDAVTTVIYDRGLVSQELVMDDLVEVLTPKGKDAKQSQTRTDI
jgi:hypothetical protein